MVVSVALYKADTMSEEVAPVGYGAKDPSVPFVAAAPGERPVPRTGLIEPGAGVDTAASSNEVELSPSVSICIDDDAAGGWYRGAVPKREGSDDLVAGYTAESKSLLREGDDESEVSGVPLDEDGCALFEIAVELLYATVRVPCQLWSWQDDVTGNAYQLDLPSFGTAASVNDCRQLLHLPELGNCRRLTRKSDALCPFHKRTSRRHRQHRARVYRLGSKGCSGKSNQYIRARLLSHDIELPCRRKLY